MAKTSDTTTFDGKTAWVYGWGKTVFGGEGSDKKLLEANQTIFTASACKQMFGTTFTDGMICAGGNGKTPCQVCKGRGPKQPKNTLIFYVKLTLFCNYTT